jgi:hypothetical protein
VVRSYVVRNVKAECRTARWALSRPRSAIATPARPASHNGPAVTRVGVAVRPGRLHLSPKSLRHGERKAESEYCEREEGQDAHQARTRPGVVPKLAGGAGALTAGAAVGLRVRGAG